MDKEDRVCLRFCFDDNWRIALLSCFTIVIIFFSQRISIKNLYSKYLPRVLCWLLAFGPSLQRTQVVNRRALFEELKWWFLRQTIICRQHILTFRKVQRDIDNKFVFLFWPETFWVKETSEKVVGKQAKRFVK